LRAISLRWIRCVFCVIIFWLELQKQFENRVVLNGHATHRLPKEILAVEMEAAALYTFARTAGVRVLCLANVTNQMGQTDDDFEKGEADGTRDARALIYAVSCSQILIPSACSSSLESFRFSLNRGFPNQRRSDSSFMLEAEASMNGTSILAGSA
jgi:hypothetical protein